MARPSPLRLAGGLVLLEGVALLVLGLVQLVRGALGEPDSRTGTLLVAAFVLAAGAVLALVGRALAAGRGGAWAPTVLAQVFVLVVALAAAQADRWVVAVPLAVLAGTVLYQLATPEARLAQGRSRD